MLRGGVGIRRKSQKANDGYADYGLRTRAERGDIIVTSRTRSKTTVDGRLREDAAGGRLYRVVVTAAAGTTRRRHRRRERVRERGRERARASEGVA